MTALWTSDEIAAATGGTATTAFAADGVAFDSREVGPGDLFVALKGEATDGHRFVPGALASGAAGVLVSEHADGPAVVVPDTMAALDDLARAARARMAGTVIGVTGSVGKTGTKEALFQAFDRIAPGLVHRSVKSYNNHTGVPLSLARMPRDTRFGVFEMGMSAAGELSALTRLVRPHVAIVTAIAPAHGANFSGEAAIAAAKAEIFEGLEPGGTAILPEDSPHRDLLHAAAARHADRVLSFGSGRGADVRAVDVTPGARGTQVTAALPGGRTLSFTVAQPGAHWVSNALAVIAAVHAAGGDVARAGLALAELPGLAGRGARLQVPVAGGTALLIDESYNANPASMRATLAVLGATGAARRIAVLGGMRELGAEADAHHRALAEPLGAAAVDYAILVGAEMAPLAERLEGQADFAHVPDAAAARAILEERLRPGDAVLVKGSNAIGLSRLVEALAASKGD
ncbi:UDP-N-acetylmuramoyl-tripeptide--D-alanyl-D-alanine ligase [Sphingomonas jejuensis]|uniref:UDP-N-acetylmuramoyl-tripeptide--D-alanyl-D-alanine ligase n=1 Tax=Sphingomonas jejuensis TaxID=904715 RepID=A0ABX0XIT4_9SPHN|nr:UDP-N-acetylmuramoyl-tripeptide--D-alanyl-D-alanine ligase [Sphingomonas jejuensis]NJC32645.1 UDP-N-acetylmuramoyl-tripeptide--D-alanyl-D-alanine ligase [Sphingomonas jejuensis]